MFSAVFSVRWRIFFHGSFESVLPFLEIIAFLFSNLHEFLSYPC